MSEELDKSVAARVSENEGGTQLSDMIDKLLARPDIINMVASAVGKQQNGGGDEKKVKEQPPPDMSDGISPNSSLPELVSAIAPAIAALGGYAQKKPQSEKLCRRDGLLCALKPYLCRERCDAIDYMIKLGKISELLKNMNKEG